MLKVFVVRYELWVDDVPVAIFLRALKLERLVHNLKISQNLTKSKKGLVRKIVRIIR